MHHVHTVLGLARVLEAIGLRHLETRALDGETRATRVFEWLAEPSIGAVQAA